MVHGLRGADCYFAKFVLEIRGVAVDGALFVAGGAVFFLLGDGGEVGGVVFGGHGYVAEEETGEGGVGSRTLRHSALT